ncbi:melatonin receptor type 1B-like [Stylophora pistillata]|uniref:melatonin receptor type 1B-like n=1 Tax=Stylophora pistillata TaxID=50429 RepID=UPI000C044512|nr:melatonin receptor type 1B-like [Stylophora pistillata]
MVAIKVHLLMAVNGVLCFIGAIVNFLVVFVVLKNRQMRDELNLLMASLSIADLIVCLVAQPMYIVILGTETGAGFKYAFELTAFIGVHASFNSLTGITINRMAVLLNPFSYTMSHHRTRLYASILGGIWGCSIILAYFFTTDSGRKVTPHVHTFMFALFIFTYAYIFWVARKQVRKISSQVQSVSFNHKAATKIKSENSAAKTSAILVSASLICFFPDIVFDWMKIVDKMRFDWAFTLLFLSSSMNPCIYVGRSGSFRLALLRTIRCIPVLRDHIVSSNRVHPIGFDSTHRSKAGASRKEKESSVRGQANGSLVEID